MPFFYLKLKIRHYPVLIFLRQSFSYLVTCFSKNANHYYYLYFLVGKVPPVCIHTYAKMIKQINAILDD
jgi:hypothetical protein